MTKKNELDLLDIPAFLLRKNWSKEDHARSHGMWDQIMRNKREHVVFNRPTDLVRPIIKTLGDRPNNPTEIKLAIGCFNYELVDKTLRLLVRQGRVRCEDGIYHLCKAT